MAKARGSEDEAMASRHPSQLMKLAPSVGPRDVYWSNMLLAWRLDHSHTHSYPRQDLDQIYFNIYQKLLH